MFAAYAGHRALSTDVTELCWSWFRRGSLGGSRTVEVDCIGKEAVMHKLVHHDRMLGGLQDESFECMERQLTAKPRE